MTHRTRSFTRSSSLLIALTLGGTTSAIDWRSGDRVVVARSEVIQDDLYVAGDDVQIDGTVNGDLLVAGRTVTINGEVRGNLWAAGETLILGGKVSQTARLAGSLIRVQSGADIGRDLLAAGSELVVAPGAVIGRDVAVGSSQARLGGQITRNAYVGANGIEVGGVIGGNAKMAVGDTAVPTRTWAAPGSPGLRFTPGGRIAGDLTLQRSDSGQAALPAGVVGGQVTYAPVTGVNVQPRPSSFAAFLNTFLSTFVGVALAGLLLLWLARPRLPGLWNSLRSAPAASLGYGTLAVVGLPVLTVLGGLALGLLAGALMLLSLGGLGLPLALIGLPALLSSAALIAWLATLGAQGFVAYLLGTWATHLLRPRGTVAPVISVLVGALLLALVLQIPVLGALTSLAALLLSLGALWLTLRGPPRRPVTPQANVPQAT
ncbi:bactofilin family protein [Deinococcus aerophilus]|uniref:Polymer-forming cytoskeletal protein n=1 Tax=Deinococcus aerophilus TaxID=522488 RepID=A0ABQ2GZA2_9DEIO|nr:polymer-forming cytoskeletal protein [Deinococcus aerophilus]GGM19296.1 hypothetical protein GCM10010841_29200 [Deinococcus aerophilus]